MNRTICRQVLECASPLALWMSYNLESARGLAHSKTLSRPCWVCLGSEVQSANYCFGEFLPVEGR
jgi:hypothetical protein